MTGRLTGATRPLLAIGGAAIGNSRVLRMVGGAGTTDRRGRQAHHRRPREDRLSILLVEQNVRLALALADPVTILSAGRWVFSGGVADVRSRQELIETTLGVATRKPD
ncbi:MAG TPA: hypothetical protein VHU42_00160 [Rhodopila sp.]|nr:hypothetical protein [Rhodopila sp.]